MVRPYSEHGEEPLPFNEHDTSIFVLKDRETKQDQLMILEEISNYEVRDETYLNYKYYRDGMEETKKFRLWKVKDDGSYTKEEFYGYKGTRTYLQTHILQSFGYPIVQYTDLLDRFFIVLPFPLFLCITEVIGLFLIVIGMERKYWMD